MDYTINNLIVGLDISSYDANTGISFDGLGILSTLAEISITEQATRIGLSLKSDVLGNRSKFHLYPLVEFAISLQSVSEGDKTSGVGIASFSKGNEIARIHESVHTGNIPLQLGLGGDFGYRISENFQVYLQAQYNFGLSETEKATVRYEIGLPNIENLTREDLEANPNILSETAAWTSKHSGVQAKIGLRFNIPKRKMKEETETKI